MPIYKCKMCGGTLELDKKATVATCEYCGTQQTLPRLDDEKKANLFDRAGHFRRNNDFDKAMGIYEQILNEDGSDAEAYWSLVLCRYGIEYVEDPTTHKRIPTVNRAQFTSIFADNDYISAIEKADSYQRAVYEQEAQVIEDIRKKILEISKKETPFDVFICYKETDDHGRRTPDSVLAQDLYFGLQGEGFKVFFSRITLEDKLGIAYEPYIFAALNSSRIMVVLGTRPEHFNAVWVKNEWSRYLTRIQNGEKKVLIPAYRDMDPYDLPDEFSHLQALDMSKLGFLQDLIRGIKKILRPEEQHTSAGDTASQNTTASANTTADTTAAATASVSASSLLKRAYIFLQDGNFINAYRYCERVLDIEPENALAYACKLCVEFRLSKLSDIAVYKGPISMITASKNYLKILQYGDDKLRAEVEGYVTQNEENRLRQKYAHALSTKQNAKNSTDYTKAANLFKAISGFEDADAQAAECSALSTEWLYQSAVSLIKSASSREDCNRAARIFESLGDYKDSCDMMKQSNDLATTIVYQKAIQQKNNATTIADYDAALRLFTEVSNYQDSQDLIEECKIEIAKLRDIAKKDEIYRKATRLSQRSKRESQQEAIALYESIADWKDSAQKADSCRATIADIEERSQLKAQLWNLRATKAKRILKIAAIVAAILVVLAIAIALVVSLVIIPAVDYQNAMEAMENGDYSYAVFLFEYLDGYKDSEALLEECRSALQDQEYNNALNLMEAKNYNAAIAAFEALEGYKDSAKMIEKCRDLIFSDAQNYINQGNFARFIEHCDVYGIQNVSIPLSKRNGYYNYVISTYKNAPSRQITYLSLLPTSHTDAQNVITMYKTLQTVKNGNYAEVFEANMDTFIRVAQTSFCLDYLTSDTYIQEFMLGRWESADGQYLEFIHQGDGSIPISYNIVVLDIDRDYYDIEDKIWSFYKNNVGFVNNVAQFTFLDGNTVQVYNYATDTTTVFSRVQ